MGWRSGFRCRPAGSQFGSSGKARRETIRHFQIRDCRIAVLGGRLKPKMKTMTPHFLRAALVLSGLLMAACSTTDQSRNSDRFLYLDTADTLQIKFRYSADPQMQMASPSLAHETEKRRFRDFYEAIGGVLPLIDLPMEYQVLEERDDPEKGHPVLELSAIRWGLTGFGELEATVMVKLSSYGEQNKLGTVRKTNQVPISFSRDVLDRLYVSTMREALTEAFHKLDRHFELPEGESESVFLEAPVPAN